MKKLLLSLLILLGAGTYVSADGITGDISEINSNEPVEPFVCSRQMMERVYSRGYTLVAANEQYMVSVYNTAPNINRKKKFIEVWELWIVTKDGADIMNRDIRTRGVGYFKINKIYDFKNKRAAFLEVTMYDCSGAVKATSSFNLEWHKVPPSSIEWDTMIGIKDGFGIK